MHCTWRSIVIFLAGLIITCGLNACGSAPWRFDPGNAASPTGVVATGGDKQVSLSWAPAQGAAGYNVYYSSVSGMAAGGGAKVAKVTGTSLQVPGLENDTRYYFAVSAYNSKGESALSAEVSAVPAAPGGFAQADLAGNWRFNALVTGVAPRWLRGSLGIGSDGSVSVTAYQDSLGGGAPPAELFTSMTLLPDGTVLQDGVAASFHGTLAANLYKDLMVGTATLAGGARMLVVLQKSVPGITFSAADIRGTGKLVAGPLAYVYHQLSAGGIPEWEYASCQVGQDQGVTYLSLNGPTPRALPGSGSKVVGLAITADGVVSETSYPGVLPQPAALISQGIMSADKMTVVATATDASGTPLLRIMQLVHPPTVLLTSNSYVLSDLAGRYGVHELYGAVPGWGYGDVTVNAAGGMLFAAFRATGGATTPAGYTVAMDPQGKLTAAARSAFHGQFAYGKDLMVATGNDAAGAAMLSIALRRE
ncbi:fibronectin type III domain-containing protein [Geomonas oryzisoli]|uniref:Fibronectin type III domain-containing protein n=1 Tax=Geomonas oryzisoli TaxID=2847992 RepID=A0ABX8J7E3_9BACT|nr:fibronectin type III domain-containing protein [Geomonas oryzisoli]QWV94248.1 fibronectin type III domain-containing protein [Geomonas oryzisoli]